MALRRPDYRTIPHTADAGFEVTAPDRPRVFADACLAFYDMVIGLERLQPQEEMVIEAEGVDDGDMLVALLSRCLFLFEVEGLAFCDAEVESISAEGITVRVRGERLVPERHDIELAVKAITYHELEVGPVEGAWRARVIVDL